MPEYYSWVHFREHSASWVDQDSESTTVLVTTHPMTLQRINKGSRDALEEVGKGKPKLLPRAILGGSTTMLVLPHTICRHIESPTLQTAAGLNCIPWWWSAEVAQMMGKREEHIGGEKQKRYLQTPRRSFTSLKKLAAIFFFWWMPMKAKHHTRI